MATEVKLPDLGEGIEDVTISRWRVKEGDEVKSGDVIVEVATDKVDTEVNAPADGKVLKINFKNGEIAPLNAALAVIGADGESVGKAKASNGAAEDKVSAVGEAVKEPDKRVLPRMPPCRSAKKRRPQRNAPHRKRRQAQMPPASAENGQDVKASPVAKRLAAKRNCAE